MRKAKNMIYYNIAELIILLFITTLETSFNYYYLLCRDGRCS